MIAEIRRQLAVHQQLAERVAEELAEPAARFASRLAEALRQGKKLLVMGNGGSAADAQHFVAEIVGRFSLERPALPAIALTTDTSILTAVGNDYGFDAVFLRQIQALAAGGDVVVGISTSGNSPNVLAALREARARGAFTVALLGRDGGSIAPAVDLPLVIPSRETPRIQEYHITLIHIVCDLVEKELFGAGA